MSKGYLIKGKDTEKELEVEVQEQADTAKSIADRRLLATIHMICNKGNNAEVRRTKDGSFSVYEVKKNRYSI